MGGIRRDKGKIAWYIKKKGHYDNFMKLSGFSVKKIEGNFIF
jgi:hypothetical protein